MPLTIIHFPYGLDGPYETRFEERRPRDPVGGDMVVVGFLTRPGRAAETVRVHWSRNGRPQASILARASATGTDEDRWLVELGVVEAGDEVEYWIAADGANGRAESPRHRFAVRRWRRLAGVSDVEPVADGIRLATVGDDGAPGPLLTLSTCPPARGLRLRIDAGPVTILGPRSAPAQEAAGVPPVIHHEGLTLGVDPTDGRLTLGNGADTTCGPLTLRWLEEGDGRLAAVELVGPLADGEALVGFGERFDALEQRGRAPGMTVYEQYKNQGDRTYLPVPFFLSSRGYGCLVEAPAGKGVAFDLFAGSPIDLLHAFTALVGNPALPPAWAFGPWMSSNEWNTQARVMAEVEQTRRHGIPATVLVIEAWSDETTFYVWNGADYAATVGAAPLRLADFTFPSDGPWPDPKAMVDALHAAGIRLLLW